MSCVVGKPKCSKSQIASDLKSQNPNRKNQEWPQPTKPRKVSSWTFHRAFRNKSSMWIVHVFLRKNTRIHKNGRNSWSFRFGPFFGLVCRGDSWKKFPQIAVSDGSTCTFKSRDLWFEPLFKSPLESQRRFPAQAVRTMSLSEKVHSVSNR